MTPKEKAKELIGNFRIYATSRADNDGYCEQTREEASKQCALICVDRILDAVAIDPVLKEFGRIADKRFDFYTEVKQEINKL